MHGSMGYCVALLAKKRPAKPQTNQSARLPKLEWWCWNCCGKHGDSSICLLHHSTWTVRVYKHTDHTVYALRSPVMFHRPKTENARQLPNEHFVESHLLVVNSLMLVKKEEMQHICHCSSSWVSKIGTSTYHAFIFMFVPQMEVSINGGTPEWMVYNRTSYIYILKWIIWGYHHY